MQPTSIILNTDSYKLSQWVQYPEGTEYVYSYIESRGGEYDKTVMFGLQPFLDYLAKPFTQADIDKAAVITAAHGVPFNREGWEYILREHGGVAPVLIKAVPEGTVMDTRNVLLTIVNTDPECYWITSYLETALLRAVWYGTTVASNSWTSKQIILEALYRSGDPSPMNLAFKLNDFGSRGVSSYESSAIGGIAHLVNFAGTDNLVAVLAAMDWYDAPVSGFSIPAMEHSTVTSWGREGEVDSFRNMLNHYAKQGALVAAVSDSYDIYNACEKLWGEELRQQVIDSGAIVVVRPDSGEPSSVVLKCLEILERKFGSTTNAKGYRVLNNVRIIQGDGIDHSSIRSILFTIQLAGYSADNVAFGQGGALLQAINRDTQRFAMKCSAIRVNGEWRDVQKDPVTDSGKKSKAGRMKLVAMQEYVFDDMDDMYPAGPVEYKTFTTNDLAPEAFDALGDELVPVFENGKVLVRYTLEEIRERARQADYVPEDMLKAA